MSDNKKTIYIIIFDTGIDVKKLTHRYPVYFFSDRYQSYHKDKIYKGEHASAVCSVFLDFLFPQATKSSSDAMLLIKFLSEKKQINDLKIINIPIIDEKNTEGWTIKSQLTEKYKELDAVLNFVKKEDFDLLNASIAIVPNFYKGEKFVEKDRYYFYSKQDLDKVHNLFNQIFKTIYQRGKITFQGAGNFDIFSGDVNINFGVSRSLPQNIIVAGVFYHPEVTSYGRSTPGTNIFVSAFGYRQVRLNDMISIKGGTSLSTPFIGSIIAAMVDRNQHLTLNDVKDILAMNAASIPNISKKNWWPKGFDLSIFTNEIKSLIEKSDAAQRKTKKTFSVDQVNSRGLFYSNQWGFGLIDKDSKKDSQIDEILEDAEVWHEINPPSHSEEVTENIEAKNLILSTEHIFEISLKDKKRVKEVCVTVDGVSVKNIISFKVTSPKGNVADCVSYSTSYSFFEQICSKLISKNSMEKEYIKKFITPIISKSFSVQQFRNEPSNGKWKFSLKLNHSNPVNVKITPTFYLDKTIKLNDNRYKITGNIVDTLEKIFIHDVNGGTDTLLWTGFKGITSIDLRPGGLLIFTDSNSGKSHSGFISKESDIENAIAGNGNDSIIGTHKNNKIRGRGGSDKVSPLGGDDDVDGGPGGDILSLSSNDNGLCTSRNFEFIDFHLYSFEKGKLKYKDLGGGEIELSYDQRKVRFFEKEVSVIRFLHNGASKIFSKGKNNFSPDQILSVNF